VISTQRIDHIYQDPRSPSPKPTRHYGDLTDTSNLTRILRVVEPDEVCNLGAPSHVAVSFETPEYPTRGGVRQTYTWLLENVATLLEA
jgi:GDPmannose 4,6-dehydratase